MSSPVLHLSAHNETACKASRHARVQHLITADENALAELGALLATLPIWSTGRVFIEVADASQITQIDLPPRMTVTWLDRSVRGAASGELAGRAARAWAGEMLCTADNTNRVYLLNEASAEHVRRHHPKPSGRPAQMN